MLHPPRQAVLKFRDRLRCHREPFIPVSPSLRGSAAKRGQINPFAGFDVFQVASRQGPQRRLVPRRKAEHARAGGVERLRAPLCRGLGQHQVSVGAAEAERADAAQSRAFRPRRQAAHHADRQMLPVHPRIGRVDMDLRRQCAAVQGEHQFQQARHAGGRFGMADIGLDRADQQRPVRRAAFTEGRRGSLDLDGIAERRAGAMRLQIADLSRIGTGAGQRLADHRLLAQPVRRGQAAAAPVLVHRRAADHRQHPVAIGQCVVQTAQHDHAHPLAADIAVRRGVEGVAMAGGRDHPRLAERQECLGRQHDVGTAGQGGGALAGPQALAGLVHRHQGRGAGGVDGQAGAVQAEQVGDAPRRHAACGAGGEVRVHRGVVALHQQIFVVRGA